MSKHIKRTVEEIYALYQAKISDFKNTTLGGRQAHRRVPFRASLNGLKLLGADFSGSLLSGVGFRYCDLSGCSFSKTDLRWSDFNHATLRRSDFSHADLRDTDLADTDLSSCDFTGADLRKADIWGSTFVRTNLSAAKLAGATLSAATLVDMDLTPLCETVNEINLGPSYVDWMTVVRSAKNDNLQQVLIQLGMPSLLADYSIEWAQSAATDVFRLFRSTFLIYGQPDEPFARKLESRLRQNNIRAFFFPKHATPGRHLHAEIRDGINSHDQAILICSKNSLDRDGVIAEIDEVLAREYRSKGESYLIPIDLDGYVSTWRSKLARVGDTVRDRVIADFRGADRDDALLDAALPRLLRALRLPGQIRRS